MAFVPNSKPTRKQFFLAPKKSFKIGSEISFSYVFDTVRFPVCVLSFKWFESHKSALMHYSVRLFKKFRIQWILENINLAIKLSCLFITEAIFFLFVRVYGFESLKINIPGIKQVGKWRFQFGFRNRVLWNKVLVVFCIIFSSFTVNNCRLSLPLLSLISREFMHLSYYIA